MGYIRLYANENPEGLPSDFIAGVRAEVTPELLAMYSEPERFHKAYANYIGYKQQHVFATNGNDHGIRILLETFGESDKM